MFLNKAINKFTRSKPFYSTIFCNMKRVYNNDLPFPAGIDIRNFQLMLNPKMLEERGEEFTVGALEHEVLHLLYRHIVKAKDIPENERMIYNFATDCFINQSILSFVTHPDLVNPKTMSEKLGIEVPTGLTSETYFKLFKQHKDKIQQEIQLQFDDHGDPGEDFSESKFNRQLVDLIKKSKEIVGAEQYGKIASDLISEINSLLNPIIPWKTVLRQFHAKAQMFSKDKSRKKRNRRYGLMFQGRKKNPTLTIAVCVDTSGSMSDDALTQVWSEINSMSNTGTLVTVIEADSEVQNVYEFNKKTVPKFKGRGGTAYGPAIDKAKELEIDAIIYIGDFDSCDTPNDPNIPFLWVGIDSRGQKPPGNFGKTIYVN